MKKSLVDVPVKINIWIRPECQKAQWEIIRKARPSIIFIQSDGGRNESENKIIEQNRQMIDSSIDWDCTVYRFYESVNQGLYTMGQKVMDFIWTKVEWCIFLEDDQIPSVSFFEFCREVLIKYKDDERIECVCGMNHLGNLSNKIPFDYFFSKQGSIWGVGLWKRSIASQTDFSYFNDSYTMSLLKQNTKSNKAIWKKLNAYGCNDYYEGHKAFLEFWIEFNMYGQNRLQIIPSKNLIKNIGCSSDSAHSNFYGTMPSNFKRVFNMETFEYDFPLRHPKYVMPDLKYEKKRNDIMLYSKNKFQILMYRLLHFEFKYLFKRFLLKKVNKEMEK